MICTSYSKSGKIVKKIVSNLQKITDDKSIFCRNCHVMKTFGSCHLIINRSPAVAIGTFVTL